MVSLSDFAGKRLCCVFYPQDNTPGWRKQTCGYRDEYGELQTECGGRRHWQMAM